MPFPRTVASVLLLGLAAAPAAVAQRTTTFGVMIGGAFSKFGGSDAKNGVLDFTQTHVGFAAGGFATLGLSPNFAIQPEALFVVKGGKADAGPASVTLKLSYFEVPVLLKVIIPAKNNSLLSPHFYAGPALGLKLDCTIKGSAGPATLSGSCDNNGIKIKSTDLGLVFGAGLDVGRAMIDVRYDLGVSRIDDSILSADVKNRTFYLLAGWSFRSPR